MRNLLGEPDRDIDMLGWPDIDGVFPPAVEGPWPSAAAADDLER